MQSPDSNETLSVENVITLTQTESREACYDVELNHTDILKNYATVECHFVLYPYNSIKCFFWFLAYVRRFSIAGFWIILFRLAFDIVGAISGYAEGPAYFAHIGGFVGGVILTMILLISKLVTRDSMDDAIVRSIKA